MDPANTVQKAVLSPALFLMNRNRKRMDSDVTKAINERNPDTELPKTKVHKTSPYKNGGVYIATPGADIAKSGR
jgi:hypothetical protein